MISNSDCRRLLPVKSGIGSEPAIGFGPSVATIFARQWPLRRGIIGSAKRLSIPDYFVPGAAPFPPAAAECWHDGAKSRKRRLR
jgi:hypothetical protein